MDRGNHNISIPKLKVYINFRTANYVEFDQVLQEIINMQNTTSISVDR
jgi:hypothetical protein